MRRWAMVSEKGGVGKSTTTLNLAAALAARGISTLVVDTDPQGNTSHVLLKGEKPRRPTLAEVLLGEADAHEAIVSETAFTGVHVLPSDASCADAAVALANEVGRERRLRLAMAEVEHDYGAVLIDTAPTRSLLTTNVLNYATSLYVPMAPSLFGVLGLAQLQTDVAQVAKYLDNRTVRIAGVILTMVERNNVAKGLETQLREILGPVVCRTRIPRSLKLEEAHARHLSIFDYAPGSPGAVAYDALAEELIGHEANRDRHPQRDSSADAA